jgi:hypothetical protein
MEQSTNHWIQQQLEHMPICAKHESNAGHSLKELLSNHRDLVGTDREAMLWLRIGFIDRPHEIVQSATKGIPAYIHGIVHRLEGDYWNANYWFRRVGQSQIVSEIQASVPLEVQSQPFDPIGFTSQVESWSRTKESAKLRELGQIATREWEALWALL